MIYLIILGSFFIRAFPRLRLKNALVSDTYFHLYCANVIRENSFRLPERLPRVMLNHTYSYPFLYHYLLALFPLRYRLWTERLTGAIFDTVSLILIFSFTFWATGEGRDPTLRNVPIMVSALFAFSPALLRIGSGPRAYNGSPRVIGQMFYLLHVLAAYYAFQTQSFLGLGLSLLAGAALIITAKFGTQVLFFFGMWFAALVSPYYFFVLAGSLLFSIALTKGRAWKVIQGHVRHSIFYRRHLQTVFLFPHIRTARKYLRSGFGSAWGVVRFSRFANAFRWYYSEPYFLHLLVTVYPQYLLIFLYISRYTQLNLLDRFLVVWMGAGFFWFLLAKLQPLLFLGEGERYLEYGIFPSLFLVVKYLPTRFESLLTTFLIYSIVSAAFFMWQYVENYRKIDQDCERTEALFSELNQLPEGIIMPIGSFHYQVLYRSRFPVLTHGANIDERLLPYKEFELVYGKYPYPSRRFEEILNRYHVSYVVTDPISLKYYKEEILKEPQEFGRFIRVLWHLPTLFVGRVIK
jgi:hypothetical protein